MNVYERATIFLVKVYTKGHLFGQNSIQKGKVLDLGTESPRVELCVVSPGSQQ